MNEDDDLMFAADETLSESAQKHVWKVLIVDDEPEVHSVTTLALDGFEYMGRELEFIHAHSGAEAKEVIASHRDIAVILLDVVMETDHAGLDVVQYIRDDLKNKFVRIILRTGQPGQAPEHEVITQYDINDYKHKTELTRQKMFTVIYTSLSAYRDLMALEANRHGLEKVIESSARIFEMRSMTDFAQGVLEQLTALLYLDQEAMVVRASGVAAEKPSDTDLQIVAATGRYRDAVGENARSVLTTHIVSEIDKAIEQGSSVFDNEHFVGFYESASGNRHAFYVSADQPLSIPDQKLVDLFCRNVAIAQETLQMLESASYT